MAHAERKCHATTARISAGTEIFELARHKQHDEVWMSMFIFVRR
jgi:hypothetical protein